MLGYLSVSIIHKCTLIPDVECMYVIILHVYTHRGLWLLASSKEPLHFGSISLPTFCLWLLIDDMVVYIF